MKVKVLLSGLDLITKGKIYDVISCIDTNNPIVYPIVLKSDDGIQRKYYFNDLCFEDVTAVLRNKTIDTILL